LSKHSSYVADYHLVESPILEEATHLIFKAKDLFMTA